MATGGGSAAGGAGDVTSSNTGSNNKRIQYYRSKYKTEGITQEILNAAYSQEPLRIEWEGPICTTRGFSQHGGECWSDTVQQLLFFADGLKEYTQEYYYKTPFSEIEKAIDKFDFLSAEQKAIVKIYAQAAQLRFINHYNFSKTGKAIFNVCIKNPDLKAPALRRRQSIIYGSNTAYSIAEYGKGSSLKGNEYLVTVLSLIAKIHVDVKKYFSHNILSVIPKTKFLNNLFEIKEPICGLFIGSYVFSKYSIASGNVSFHRYKKTKDLPGHAIGLFKCDTQMYFYDDNFGMIKTDISYEVLKSVKLIIHFRTKSMESHIYYYRFKENDRKNNSSGKESNEWPNGENEWPNGENDAETTEINSNYILDQTEEKINGETVYKTFFSTSINDLEIYDKSINNFREIKDKTLKSWESFTVITYLITSVHALTLPSGETEIVGMTNTGVPIYNFKKFVGESTRRAQRRGGRLTRKRRSMRRRAMR